MADGDLLDTSTTLDSLSLKTKDLQTSANGFARAMTQAFSTSITGGKQFDDVLKSLALRISGLAVGLAFKPLTSSLSSGINSLLSGLTGGTGTVAASTGTSGATSMFASGGVIGAPTYFPMADGGMGLAGEAGPEAIIPPTRGSDGRLGVAGGSGGGNTITVQIATPDPDSFRRSESYITGQIARAVARGQRSL